MVKEATGWLMLLLQDIFSRQQTDLKRVQGPATVLAPPQSALVLQTPSSPPEKQGRPRSGAATRGKFVSRRGSNNHFGSRGEIQSTPSTSLWEERQERRRERNISLNMERGTATN